MRVFFFPFLNRQRCVLYCPVNCYELQAFKKHYFLIGSCDLLHEECKWYVKFAFTFAFRKILRQIGKIFSGTEIPDLCKCVSRGVV